MGNVYVKIAIVMIIQIIYAYNANHFGNKIYLIIFFILFIVVFCVLII